MVKLYLILLSLMFTWSVFCAGNDTTQATTDSTNSNSNNNSNNSNSNSNGNSSGSSINNKSKDSDTNDPTPTDKDSPSNSKSSQSSASSSSKVKIPSNAARGLITMLEPPVAQNFVAGWAIGTVAKMKWKYDNNVKIKPNNISIIAIRQDGGTIVTYNIGLELPNDTMDYEWDTAEFAADVNNPPLVESENYKLYMYDTARSYLAGAPAGGLNPFTRQFRMYKGSDGGSNVCLKCLSAANFTPPQLTLTFLVMLLPFLLLQ